MYDPIVLLGDLLGIEDAYATCDQIVHFVHEKTLKSKSKTAFGKLIKILDLYERNKKLSEVNNYSG